jgi:hypothetical protein
MNDIEKKLMDVLKSNDPNLSRCPTCRINEALKLWTYFGLSDAMGKSSKPNGEKLAPYPSYCANHRIF